MQKFEVLRQPLMGELAMSRKKERKRKNAIYSGHLRLCQQPRAAHALRSDQNAIYSGHLRFCLQPKGSARTPLGPRYEILSSLPSNLGEKNIYSNV